MSNSLSLVHQLYNSLSATQTTQPTANRHDLLKVLLKVYVRLNHQEDDVPLINRLVHYIYFTRVTCQLTFSPEQQALITQLADIGKYAGTNGCYRSNYGDKTQF